MPQGRALPFGLIGLGAALAVLVLLWLGVNAAGGQLRSTRAMAMTGSAPPCGASTSAPWIDAAVGSPRCCTRTRTSRK